MIEGNESLLNKPYPCNQLHHEYCKQITHITSLSFIPKDFCQYLNKFVKFLIESVIRNQLQDAKLIVTKVYSLWICIHKNHAFFYAGQQWLPQMKVFDIPIMIPLLGKIYPLVPSLIFH